MNYFRTTINFSRNSCPCEAVIASHSEVCDEDGNDIFDVFKYDRVATYDDAIANKNWLFKQPGTTGIDGGKLGLKFLRSETTVNFQSFAKHET